MKGKNIDTVKNGIYKVFEQFEDGKITSIEMCNKIERLCKGNGKKSYWWRFFNNDTLVNDADTVRESTQTITNWQYLRECIQIALNERQLTVYYS